MSNFPNPHHFIEHRVFMQQMLPGINPVSINKEILAEFKLNKCHTIFWGYDYTDYYLQTVLSKLTAKEVKQRLHDDRESNFQMSHNGY